MKTNGKDIAQKILDRLIQKVKILAQKRIIPHLAIILMGDDPSSSIYVSRKEKKAREIGIKVTVIRLTPTIGNYKLKSIIYALNRDPLVHGIIIQRPLLLYVHKDLLNTLVDPFKDVDAFHPNTKFEPPISKAVIAILEHIYSSKKCPKKKRGIKFDQWLISQNVVVVGKGETGGRPIIATLKKLGVKPFIVDTKTKSPARVIQDADILITTVGKPNLIAPKMLKKGVILIGVGIHKGSDGKLHADYDEKKIKNIASFYTGVPGGVGPVNVAMLLENLIIAASLRIH